jgi:hypothetical protein
MMRHRVIRSSLRSAVALVAFAGLAGCDDDGSGPGNSLRPEDVAGVYRVCQLAFDPLGTVLPPVDIRARAFELPGGNDDPVIGLDPDAQQTVELTYIPKGQVNDRELRGNYTLRSESTVELRFNTSGVNPKSLLIPENRRMDFDFQESPNRLGMGASSQYNVSRAEYVALSGEDPANIPESITGVLVADFRTDPCS